MPLYVFRCASGHESEHHRDPDDASRDARCPDCGEAARRLYRLRGIGFKGSGFHNTDNPSESRLRGVHRRADGSITHWFGDGQARRLLS
jgi:putative FmdB family regulatory protein